MGAEKGGHDVDGTHGTDTARRAEHACFGLQIEAVSRFDFDRGYALGDQMIESGKGSRNQLVFACRSRRPDTRYNSAAGAGNILIAGSCQPQLEFACAVARVDNVGVTIDQTGCDPSAIEADTFIGVAVGRQFASISGENDAAVLGSDNAILHDAKTVTL